MTARDWTKTLWRTTYKGAAFWVQTDTEGGGRRIVIHEFPMRDTPYLEDLGERYREFTVTAYVASDRADTEAAALMSTCAQRGPGPVVLPTIGPVVVRCLEFSRRHDLDRLGYIAHELRFVREGASGALASVASLINMIFIQAESASSIVAQAFAAASVIAGVPDYVKGALQDGTETALATLDAIRTTTGIDPVVSAEQRTVIETAYAALPDIMTNSDATALEAVGKDIVSVAMAMAENIDPPTALTTFSEILTTTPVIVSNATPLPSIWHGQVEQNAQAANALLRLAAITAYCEAVAKVSLTDRNSAITLRANVSSFIDAQLETLPSDDHGLFLAMTKLRDATVEYLSRSIIDLAPVVRVNANLSMPSLYWAWRLYADPTRSNELFERNRVPHPSFMPPTFEALSN